MQVRVSEYNQLKGQVNQQNRKATGSLAVRDLSGLVSSKDIISTENLVTLFVVVSKHNKLEWQSSYEKFCEFVVSHLSAQGVASKELLIFIKLLAAHHFMWFQKNMFMCRYLGHQKWLQKTMTMPCSQSHYSGELQTHSRLPPGHVAFRYHSVFTSQICLQAPWCCMLSCRQCADCRLCHRLLNSFVNQLHA